MARPVMNHCDYFSHDNDIRNHRKIKALDNEFRKVTNGVGRIGYQFWTMMLEYLTGIDGHEFEYGTRENTYFAAEMQLPLSTTSEMIQFAIDIDLLQKSPEGFVFSAELHKRLDHVYVKRKRDRKLSENRIKKTKVKPVNEKQAVLALTPAITKIQTAKTLLSPAIVHKVNQTKVNKIKVGGVCNTVSNESLPEATPQDFPTHTPAEPHPFEKKYNSFTEWVDKNAAQVRRLPEFITIDEYEELLKDFPSEEGKNYIRSQLRNMHNDKNLLQKYTNAYTTLRKWIQMDRDQRKNYFSKR
jgi:hypothetical protein